MIRILIGLAVIVSLLVSSTRIARADWSFDLESGVAFNGYNDVRIPGNAGTDFSFSEDLKTENANFIRFRLTKDLGDRHRLSMLVAPLRLNASGIVNRDIYFNGTMFAADVHLSGIYRFDSYRITYQYILTRSERFQAGIGLTAKIRDASIELEDAGQYTKNSNTGFVPLINFALDYRFGSKLGVIFEGDALAAPQGRAEDVLLALYGNPIKNLRLRMGYRMLEGGVDVDKVYNFTIVHYLSAGVTWSF